MYCIEVSNSIKYWIANETEMRKYRQEKRKRNMCVMVGYEYWNSIPGCSMKVSVGNNIVFYFSQSIISIFSLLSSIPWTRKNVEKTDIRTRSFDKTYVCKWSIYFDLFVSRHLDVEEECSYYIPFKPFIISKSNCFAVYFAKRLYLIFYFKNIWIIKSP